LKERKTILITAGSDIAAPLFDLIGDSLHLPLEQFEYFTDPDSDRALNEVLDSFTFIIYGNLRNARYFLEWAQSKGKISSVQKRINLVHDRVTASFLEKEGIPAILPRENARPIDILEFLLRISKEGSTLYPTTDNHTEEMPGLLQELEMPVSEFTVCREVTVSGELLAEYRRKISEEQFYSILIHNRSSLTRIKTAFPDLNLSEYKLIAGSQGVADKLAEEGLEPDARAHGTWQSIAKVLEDIR
jgi:hypothetical protein